VAAIRLTCSIEGCTASWNVSSPAKMKSSMDEHRRRFHPNWIAPPPKPASSYRLDYSR
jgi:hypothetical protein